MIDTMNIFFTILEPLQPFAFSSSSSRKPNKREYRIYTERLQALITGLILGQSLSGEKFNKLVEEISKLKK